MPEKLALALEKMRSALNLIDEAGGPHDVGAHLDLAICRLVSQVGDQEKRGQLKTHPFTLGRDPD